MFGVHFEPSNRVSTRPRMTASDDAIDIRPQVPLEVIITCTDIPIDPSCQDPGTPASKATLVKKITVLMNVS
eukprot:713907-Amphidinium_carterae.1